MVEIQRGAGCVGGCPLGSLASESADEDELIRQVLLKSFQRWERAFIGGIQQMKDLGMLRQEADTGLLATTLLAALQGGLLLCQAWKDVSPQETSLNGAVGYLRTFAVWPIACDACMSVRRDPWDGLLRAVSQGAGPSHRLRIVGERESDFNRAGPCAHQKVRCSGDAWTS